MTAPGRSQRPFLALQLADQPRLPLDRLAVVIGANDVVNPTRATTLKPHRRDADLEVDRARSVVVLKRGKGAAFRG